MEPTETHPLRNPCPKCNHSIGVIEQRGFQDVVRCATCGHYSHNAPRSETGKPQRPVSRRGNAIKPKARFRIIARANGVCELCGSKTELHVDHLISVNEFERNGYPPEEYNADWNLAALCAECNLGKSDLPLPVHVVLAIQMKRLKAMVNKPKPENTDEDIPF